MKTSNKIFLSFLIFLFGGITLLFVFSKSRRGYDYTTNLVNKEEMVAHFSVVVAEPGAFLVLKNGLKFKISQSYLKEGVPNFVSYEVRNDTLFMYSVKKEHSNESNFMTIPVVYCKNVKSIIAKEKTNVNLNNYQVDSLYVNLNKSDFFWKDFNKAAFINIESEDSYLHLNGDCIEKINLKLDKTSLYINSKKSTKKVSGSLINHSYLDVDIDGKISLEVDKSSKLYYVN